MIHHIFIIRSYWNWVLKMGSFYNYSLWPCPVFLADLDILTENILLMNNIVSIPLPKAGLWVTIFLSGFDESEELELWTSISSMVDSLRVGLIIFRLLLYLWRGVGTVDKGKDMPKVFISDFELIDDAIIFTNGTNYSFILFLFLMLLFI